jgi:hypothetical protein
VLFSGDPLFGAPLAGESLLGELPAPPLDGDAPGDPLPLVSVPGALVVEPLGALLVPIPPLSLPDVPGVTALSPSPAPVPVVPVWFGLVSIGGSAVGEFAGFVDVPVESPGVVVVPEVLLGLGVAP